MATAPAGGPLKGTREVVMGGKASRDKGNRDERDVVNTLDKAGLVAWRVPFSGAMANYPGDVQFGLACGRCDGWGHCADINGALVTQGMSTYVCPVCNGQRMHMDYRYVGECKVRRDGFKSIYGWIEDVDVLFIRADRKPRLVVLKEVDYISLLKGQR